MNPLLKVMSAISIAMIVVVLFSVRRSHIRVEYSVSWLGGAITLLVLSRWQWGLSKMAQLLGITSGPLALLVSVFVVFLAFFYRYSVILSDLKDANIALAQKVAILEFELQSHTNEKQQEIHP